MRYAASAVRAMGMPMRFWLLAREPVGIKGTPKLGPDASPLTEAAERLRTATAPDHRTPAPIDQPQGTSSACSVASVPTGDRHGPHSSPMGAFDAANDRVPMMDVGRGRYVPCRPTDAKPPEAVPRPASAGHGPLAGETRGPVCVKAPRRG